MKPLIVLPLALLPALALAGSITLTLTDEQETDNAKICIYENSNYTFTYITKGACPYAKTFNTEDSEE
ncbi:hypothetical protein RE060_000398 [Klebsiella pneumoniae]|uniref:hypothetical protein n=1 Tax=Klebsiella TaxID=570 RepID=UPI0027E6EE9D|nr:hypothetical protein [Klebsiella pneumoniae]MDU2919584.1 hypothetical protein [Klebsiella quasipneumoniae]EKZ6452886.1 hypothetical protein [Klebsiella pneumoniae]MDX6902924.1 hypothetical protein [Klebsiella pneumoniae]MEA4301475.1 hypothetical protein [Klebsiella pneumoniae]HEE1628748.1 hypothetical protein [Klebsiella pneumoniae]